MAHPLQPLLPISLVASQGPPMTQVGQLVGQVHQDALVSGQHHVALFGDVALGGALSFQRLLQFVGQIKPILLLIKPCVRLVFQLIITIQRLLVLTRYLTQ